MAPADPDQQDDREREREALGRSRGGHSTKLHLRVEGGGKPMRRHLRRRGIRAVIPSKSNQPLRRGFDRAAYRGRKRVERT